jgi:hypothetical protein
MSQNSLDYWRINNGNSIHESNSSARDVLDISTGSNFVADIFHSIEVKMDNQARLKELSRQLDLLQRADRPSDDERLRMVAIRNELNLIRRNMLGPGVVERDRLTPEETNGIEHVRVHFSTKVGDVCQLCGRVRG